jgi:hypothetical protein
LSFGVGGYETFGLQRGRLKISIFFSLSAVMTTEKIQFFFDSQW